MAVFCTSLLGIAAWIAAAVYFKLQDSRGKNNWGLWSWSCANKSLQNGKMSFATMCVEMVRVEIPVVLSSAVMSR